MRDVPLPTQAERDATDFAIAVNADGYRDGEDADPETADQLDTARDVIQSDAYIPGLVAHDVWDILVEHDHFKIASDHRYNDGVDSEPMIDVLYHLIVFNADRLYESYSELRDWMINEHGITTAEDGAFTSVPLPDQQMVDAVTHAIDVNKTYYADTGHDDVYDLLTDAHDRIITDEVVPGPVVPHIWDILFEQSHFKTAVDHRYNNGEDRKPLLDVTRLFVALNGKAIHELYSEYRNAHNGTEDGTDDI